MWTITLPSVCISVCPSVCHFQSVFPNFVRIGWRYSCGFVWIVTNQVWVSLRLTYFHWTTPLHELHAWVSFPHLSQHCYLSRFRFVTLELFLSEWSLSISLGYTQNVSFDIVACRIYIIFNITYFFQNEWIQTL
jgi:hypothetical protein